MAAKHLIIIIIIIKLFSSLEVEMGLLKLVWEVRIRCPVYWLKIMCDPMYENRLSRRIAVEAMNSNAGWIKKLRKCTECFGWSDIEGGVLGVLILWKFVVC